MFDKILVGTRIVEWKIVASKHQVMDYNQVQNNLKQNVDTYWWRIIYVQNISFLFIQSLTFFLADPILVALRRCLASAAL